MSSNPRPAPRPHDSPYETTGLSERARVWWLSVDYDLDSYPNELGDSRPTGTRRPIESMPFGRWVRDVYGRVFWQPEGGDAA